jgi:hypothetical protein
MWALPALRFNCAMTHYSIKIDSPERLEIESAAFPSDLAHALAHALLKFDKQGSHRPPYKVRAVEDGNARDLTKAEQEAFRTALDEAFDRLTEEPADKQGQRPVMR